jgi:hypothetical protein
MAIIKMHDKRRGVTYVYESKSYWDKEAGQPRSRRKLLGRLDPATGETVPTGRRGRPRKAPSSAPPLDAAGATYKALYEDGQARLREMEAQLLRAREELALSESRRASLERRVAGALKALGGPGEPQEG